MLKNDGNAQFKLKNLNEAEQYYRNAFLHANTVENNQSDSFKNLKKTILQNMSVCTNNSGFYKESID